MLINTPLYSKLGTIPYLPFSYLPSLHISLSTQMTVINSIHIAFLILSSICNISHTHGRLLPMEHPVVGNLRRKIVETAGVAPLGTRPPAFQHNTSSPGDGDAEVLGGDFRPTTPGHSPGVGHSLAPASHVESKIH